MSHKSARMHRLMELSACNWDWYTLMKLLIETNAPGIGFACVRQRADPLQPQQFAKPGPGGFTWLTAVLSVSQRQHCSILHFLVLGWNMVKHGGTMWNGSTGSIVHPVRLTNCRLRPGLPQVHSARPGPHLLWPVQ